MAAEFLSEKTYVDQAENVIKRLKKPFFDKNGKEIKPELVSMSKLRNILSIAADIYDSSSRELGTELGDELISRIQYLRVRIVYECGRDSKPFPLQKFVKEAQILDYLQMIGNEKKNYLVFYHYLEALVAFHKYSGGKD